MGDRSHPQLSSRVLDGHNFSEEKPNMNYPSYGNPYVTPERWEDYCFGAAFCLFARVPKAFRHVIQYGIDKEALLAESQAWSHGEQILVRVALDFFDGGCVREHGYESPHIGEIVGTLDEANLAALVTAIAIKRRLHPADLALG